MKKSILLLLVLITSFGYAQEVDVKDTVRWYVKDGDTLIGSYSTNQGNAIEKLLNHKLKHPNSNPEIFPEGFVRVVTKDFDVATENYKSPLIDRLTLIDSSYTIYVDSKVYNQEPDGYVLFINDKIYPKTIKAEELNAIEIIDTIINPVFRLMPIYNDLLSNTITKDQ